MQPFVFVVGCPRSGTSAVGMALQGRAGYGGFHEGHIAPHLLRLGKEVSERFERHRISLGANDKLHDQSGSRMMIGAVTEAELARHFALLVRRLFGEHLSPPWLDKTPGAPMLECLPEIAAAFPEAKFIYLHRRLNENLASHGRKFADIKPIHAASHWARCKFLWDENKHLVKNRMLEIDQRDILLHPFQTAERLQYFLDIPSDLAYKVGVEFSYARVERTAGGAAPLDWSDLNLPDDLAKEIRDVTTPAMEAYGYEYGARYRKSDPPVTFLAHNPSQPASGTIAVGDDVHLLLPADQSEITANFAFPKLLPGDRLRGVVLVERAGHKKMHLRVREWSGHKAIVDRVFDLNGIAAAELDLALEAGNDLKVEFKIVVGSSVPGEFILKLRALRIERLDGSAIANEEAPVALEIERAAE